MVGRVSRWMTPQEIEKHLKEGNYTESVMREIMADPHFAIFSGAFIDLVIKRRKISINFIREMRAIIKRIDWNKFLMWHKDYYTEEERKQIQSEFNVVYKWGYYDEER